MNFLITGGSGYIGKHLVKKLAKDKTNKLYVLVRGKVRATDSDNIMEVQVDLSSSDIKNLLPTEIDIVLHLAQSSKYREFPSGAEDMFKVGVNGTFQLLEWAKSAGVKKFVYFSSGNVYREEKRKLLESDSCDPVSFYGASKLCAELIVKQYSLFFQPIVLRIFGVYGPGQIGMTIPNLIRKVKQAEEITLAKGVGMYFTPIYIDDCVEFVIRLCELDGIEKTPQVFNISGEEVVTVADVAKTIHNLIGKAPVLRITDQYPTWLQGSNEKVKMTTGFTPIFPFDQGLSHTLK